jgi:hypothetical protein
MSGQYLNIESRERQMAGFLASLADFTVTTGETVSADVVRANPNVSLYCLDEASKCAIFVELPADVDLAVLAPAGQLILWRIANGFYL